MSQEVRLTDRARPTSRFTSLFSRTAPQPPATGRISPRTAGGRRIFPLSSPARMSSTATDITAPTQKRPPRPSLRAMDVYARSTQFRYSLRAGTTLLISVTVAARSKPKTAMSRVRQLREVASF
jgi:hypothetical protein